jgi:hypothetical protein
MAWRVHFLVCVTRCFFDFSRAWGNGGPAPSFLFFIGWPAPNFFRGSFADCFGVTMKINRETEDRNEMHGDHRARAAELISWEGSMPSSYSTSNTTSTSSSLSFAQSVGLTPID